MGSGKTWIGVRYLENYGKCTGTSAHIIDYAHIRSQLQSSSKDTYPAFGFKGKHLVFDEAHHLLDLFRDPTISHEHRHTFFHEIRTAAHFLLLTGTPMYTDVYDLPLLINLCGPRDVPVPVLPFAKRLFFRRYFRTNRTKSAVHGWAQPIMDKLHLNCQGQVFGSILLFVTGSLVLGAKTGNVALTSAAISTSGALNATTWLSSLKMTAWMGLMAKASATTAGLVYAGGFIVTTLVLALLLAYIVKRLRRCSQTDDLHTLNTAKLADDISPYVHFYTQHPFYTRLRRKYAQATRRRMRVCEPYNNNQRRSRRGNTVVPSAPTQPGYKGADQTSTPDSFAERCTPPDVHYRNHFHTIVHEPVTHVPYTQAQAYLFLDCCTGILPEKYQSFIGDVQTAKGHQFPIFGEELDTDAQFHDRGRAIGNMALSTQDILHSSTSLAKAFDKHCKTGRARSRSSDSDFWKQHKTLYVTEDAWHHIPSVRSQSNPEIGKRGRPSRESGRHKRVQSDSVAHTSHRHGRISTSPKGPRSNPPLCVPNKFVAILTRILEGYHRTQEEPTTGTRAHSRRSSSHTSRQRGGVRLFTRRRSSASKDVTFVNLPRVDPAFAAVYSDFDATGTQQFKAYVHWCSRRGRAPRWSWKTHAIGDAVFTFEKDRLKVSDVAKSDNEMRGTHIVLLAGAAKSEGIDLPFVQQLHIMEPILHYSQREQLYARINRYQHTKTTDGLSKPKHVYQYCANVSRFLDQLVLKMRHWHQSQYKQRSWVFWKRYTRFDQDLTPDTVVLRQQVQATQILNELRLHLADNGSHTVVQQSLLTANRVRTGKMTHWQAPKVDSSENPEDEYTLEDLVHKRLSGSTSKRRSTRRSASRLSVPPT